MADIFANHKATAAAACCSRPVGVESDSVTSFLTEQLLLSIRLRRNP